MATHITNATELQNMNLNMNEDYILDNDIDLTGIDWKPIGYGDQQFTDLSTAGQFTGTFDGQGFTISNLSVSATNSALGVVGGLFGFLGNGSSRPSKGNPPIKNATVSNLNLSNVSLTGHYALGGLAGFIIGADITNVHLDGVEISWDGISTVHACGGFGGDCYNISIDTTIITNCSVDDVSITGKLSQYIGGFLGDCFVSSAVTDFVVHKCFATNVSIIGNAGTAGFNGVGGFAGLLTGTIYDCYATGTIDGSGILTVFYDVGGFAGEIDATFNNYNCYSNVEIISVEVTQDYNGIGGYIGKFYGGPTNSIRNVYSVGTITVTSLAQGVGGLIGIYDNGDLSTPSLALINNCAWLTSIVNCAISQLDRSTYSAWNSGTTYSIGDKVFSGSYNWISIKNSNLNKSPAFQPSWWRKLYTRVNTLTELSFGTDEADISNFYTTDHPVYAQV
jgi:hypothetical protein